jgi:hypothetical protein
MNRHSIDLEQGRVTGKEAKPSAERPSAASVEVGRPIIDLERDVAIAAGGVNRVASELSGEELSAP